MVFSLCQYKVSDRDFNPGIAMPENYARTAMPGLDNTPSNLVRAASAEFTPGDCWNQLPWLKQEAFRQFKRNA
ncbi:hypothetical protein MiSe_67580 [Microseira wollei NIES-4236]|uniref:Uncharacterized protein n=2 Tax=Microseira wollei TaxID=467598 RepID=A0AAV3XHN7_9CYAN|nr:hypothetical protein MiSe_67580 [Microseira wollei NIES-4236]